MTISSLGLLFDFCEARTPILYLAIHSNLHFSQAGDIADVGWFKRNPT
ncbi:hypothetical protein FDUTEX481_09329 [Tolypothrix sp. PCC 7601]|nr:hypothetical protein FDUTEX481_09329 [Tolypothrix sp. PCC 7601]